MIALQHVPARPVHYSGEALTSREIEILELSGKGLSIKGVAQALGISPGTVGWHLKNSYQKLGASSREEALRKARALHLIDALFACPVCSGLVAKAS